MNNANHNGMIYVRALVPLSLECRLRDLCKSARSVNGVDYGITFQRVLSLGITALERQNYEDLK